MQIGSGTQSLVVQAGEPEAFLQIFLEAVQSSQLDRLRGSLSARGRAPEHLVTGIHQKSDLLADDESGAIDMRAMAAPIFNDGSDSVAAHASAGRVQ